MIFIVNLLADVAADHLEKIDGVKRKVPTFEDLLREVEEEERGQVAAIVMTV